MPGLFAEIAVAQHKDHAGLLHQLLSVSQNNRRVYYSKIQKLIAVAYGPLAKLKVIRDVNLHAPGYKLITIWSREEAFFFILIQPFIVALENDEFGRGCSSL